MHTTDQRRTHLPRRLVSDPAARILDDHAGLGPRPVRRECVTSSLDVDSSVVAGVATFYTMYHLEPVGRHVIQVCCTLSCSLMGAEALVKRFEQKLGIHVGETTKDGRFTLKKVECLASCGTAPMLQVNEDKFLENLTEKDVDRIVDSLK